MQVSIGDAGRQPPGMPPAPHPRVRIAECKAEFSADMASLSA